MKLNFICLLANDVAVTVRFWRDAMQLAMTYYDETIGYASFDTGGSTLAIFGRDAFAEMIGTARPTSAPTGYPGYLSFLVDDVDATYTRLIEHGASSVAAPRDYPMLQARQAHLSDPDGHLIEIYKPLSKPDEPTA